MSSEAPLRSAIYAIGATPSTGPFPIPFPFHDADTVQVWVNKVRVFGFTVTQPIAFSADGAFVTLSSPIANASLAVVSGTGSVRQLESVFRQIDLSKEIDRLFALLQEQEQFGLREAGRRGFIDMRGLILRGLTAGVEPNDAATLGNVQAAVSNLLPKFTISELPPSGGSEGDMWFQYST
jgi:hypothetical protein